MVEEQVILVDEKDQEIGLMGKMEAHEKAVLHRAFSVFVQNNKGEIIKNIQEEEYLLIKEFTCLI